MKDKPQKFGLSLSGGAALGFAHIGALRAIEKFDLTITDVSGASMGAIIASLYCQGYNSYEIEEVVAESGMGSILNILSRGRIGTLPGLSSHEKSEELLTKMIPHNSFEGLSRNLHVSVTDITEPDWHIISEGELIPIVLASMSIPVLFEPELIGNKIFVDGGVMNNLPVEPLRERYLKIIGVDVQDICSLKHKLTTKRMTLRYYGAMMKQMQRHRVAMCDIYVNFPQLSTYDLYSFNKYSELIEIGYSQTMKILEESQQKGLL